MVRTHQGSPKKSIAYEYSFSFLNLTCYRCATSRSWFGLFSSANFSGDGADLGSAPEYFAYAQSLHLALNCRSFSLARKTALRNQLCLSEKSEQRQSGSHFKLSSRASTISWPDFAITSSGRFSCRMIAIRRQAVNVQKDE